MTERAQRRLAAIVAADVAGYSRLIGADEEGTLEALKAHRRDLIDPLIADYGGRIANTAGDSVLVEYPSAVDAVRSALAIQQGMMARNGDVVPDKQIRFRVGINVGDVVAEGGDLLGDGVNVAARLQEIAEPDGLCLSDDAFRQVRGKVEPDFTDGGEVSLKNIAAPVRVWRWSPGAAGSAAASMPSAAASATSPAKPSIAVLPFDNMSRDPEQEFFADGITEDVITELSRFRALFVIARNSTFTYKGQSVNVQTVGRELGVRYVVEGSVRTAGARVRVTAQLVDSQSSNHLWAERYDRDLTDIFAVQDDITHAIVTAVAPEVMVAEDASALRKAPDNLNAWECVVRANGLMANVSREDFAAAAALYDQAIGLDPNYAVAYSAKAYLTIWNAFQGWGGRISEDLAQALAAAQRALALDAGDAMAHYAAGFVHTLARNSDRALEEQRTAIKLNPNSADAYFGLAMVHAYGGEVDAALGAIVTARQLSPRSWFDSALTAFQALAHFCAGRDEEAVRLAARSIEERENFAVPHLVLAAALGQLGRIDDARGAVAKVMAQYPHFGLSRHARAVPIVHVAVRDRYIDGLRKAGLPE